MTMKNSTDIKNNFKSKLPTLLLVLVAVVLALVVYQRWVHSPWTRHGQVRANIVKIAPRVSGYIVEVAVLDNQFVRKGELVFRIDPSSYQLAADKAQVRLRQAREHVSALEATVTAAAARVLQSEAGVVAARAMIEQQQAALANARSESGRATRLLGDKAGSVENAEKKAATVLELQAAVDSARAALSEAEAAVASAQAGFDQARANLGEPGDANVRIREAIVQLEDARLHLGWTSIHAPFDGYITNLDVNEGQFAAPGHPVAAFVDSSSFRVHGYFQESKLKHIEPGDRAEMTLMSHPGVELTGVVDSIGYAINPPHTASTEGAMYLVPQIQPTFDWIRLPQRVPVRIRLEDVPDDIQLVSGMTASVAIRPVRED
jgi:multidrug resistance efflux pump